MNDRKILSATLADIYLQQGYIEKAVEIYERLARRDPRNTFYRQRLESIKNDLKSKQQGPAFKRLLNKKLW
jgi:hypothetical protein